MTKAINYIRQRIDERSFLNQYNANDVKRVASQQWWIEDFLVAKNNNVEDAIEFFSRCLVWRKKFEIEKITIYNLSDALAENFIYFHGSDLNDCDIMWINWNRFQFISSHLFAKRVLVLWLERHLMETQNTSFTLMINFHNCNKTDIDTEFTEFLFECLNEYYPLCVEKILLYELPHSIANLWIDLAYSLKNNLTNFFALEVDRISINLYISYEFLPRSMGGKDDYFFTLHRLPYCIYSKNHLAHGDFANNNINDLKKLIETEKHLKNKQQQQSENYSLKKPFPNDLMENMESENISIVSSFLDLNVKDEILLEKNNKGEYAAEFVLKNIDLNHSQIFKIKATAVQKFHVRPTLGVLKPNSSQIISIILNKEYEKSFQSELFLVSSILAISFEPTIESLQNFSKLFTNLNPSDVFQLKLNCFLKNDCIKDKSQKEDSQLNEDNSKTLLDNDLAMLLAKRELLFLSQINELRQQLNINRIILIIIIVFQAILTIHLLKRN